MLVPRTRSQFESINQQLKLGAQKCVSKNAHIPSEKKQAIHPFSQTKRIEKKIPARKLGSDLSIFQLGGPDWDPDP